MLSALRSKEWRHWFHRRLAWRAILSGVLYLLLPLLVRKLGEWGMPVDPDHALYLRNGLFYATVGLVLMHERRPPRGEGQGGLGLFGVRKEK